MAILEGTLSKWTNVMKGWQYRWFVLDENAGLLSYYTSKEKMMKGVRRGCVRLKGAVIGIEDQEDNTFTITVDHKTFHFQARDGDEREKWVRRLEDTIRRHANRGRLYDNHNNYNSLMHNSSKRANHLQLLDRRVSEADAYLQLMIEQINKIDKRISDISDPEEKLKCKGLQETASEMLDHIKHSIVTLQIAKNMANPINGMYQGPSTIVVKPNTNKNMNESNDQDIADDEEDDEEEEDGVILPPVGIPSIQSGIEMGSECLEKRKNNPTSINSTSSVLGFVVPETSYSSSEGEDDFYDANDDPFTSQGNSPACRPFSDSQRTDGIEQSSADKTSSSGTSAIHQPLTSSSSSSVNESKIDKDVIVDDKITLSSTKITNTTTSSKRSIPFQSDGTLDYDALYEDDDETDLSMESHGSVVAHLLSQVKIGMDLTKVVLPTFILERRSLLEMYADYFAHPDLFLKIAELDNPRDRMVQVCRWYLSAYHAGRKSSVAKKPYNPILGEIFQCHWDLPDEKPDNEVVDDGPIPWCKRHQLTFLAEQVSHHPPISAFYAEHYNKKITFLAHVWTKSKFLGLSIGVHNVGQGIVTLCDLNEEYILTFPNGYGRSILTVPWIELGGSVTINCPQTGYHAEIEFLTKPFYGGKKNKVTAEIYAPNEKKSFVSIAGEWSGLMEAKWHDSAKPKTEVFVDVNKIPIFKKQVRPISEQTEYESRNVWKEVTAGLKLNEIERATNAKCQVEQKQREEAKIRKDNDGIWETKYFKAVGDAWIYTNPLSQRLYIQDKENKR